LPAISLVVATAVSLIGSELTIVALPWFVLQTTGSAAQTGITGAFASLPQFISGILGGAVIDRVGYRRISVVADLVSGSGIAAVPLLYATTGLAFWQLLGLVFVGTLLSIPGLTARRAMLPELAHAAAWRLERMNAMFEGVTYLALLVGPAVAGVLVSAIGAANVLWVDACTFLFSAVVIRLGVPRITAARQQSEPIASQLTGGLRFLGRDRLLLALAVQLSITNFLFGPLFSVILPVYARDVYGSPTALGLLLAALGLGSVIGTIGYGVIGHRMSRRALWIAGYMVVPFGFAALVVALPLWAVLGVYFLSGVVSGPVNPLLVTIRHERIPPELRGRVFSTFSAVAQIAQPLGIATGGAAVELLGFATAVVAFGTAAAVVALSLLLLPALRTMDANVAYAGTPRE
jgi:MFS family permease